MRKIQQGKGEPAQTHCLVEGWKCIDEAWERNEPTCILITEKALSRWESSWKRDQRVPLYVVEEKVLVDLCSTSHPEGILAASIRPELTPWEPTAKGPHLCLYQWRDPSNVGAVIRTARGLGMSSVTMIGSGPDFFSPKVIRSSMGSVFHINLHRSDSETCLAQTDLFCAAAGGQTLATCSPSTSPLLVLGSESHGLPEAFLNAGTVVGIPLHGGLESLSAPIAASILMDQIQRPLSPKP